MQLGALARPGPTPDDVATALVDGAARLGHRPAVTQLLPAGRQEQSVASLAQWAAKGAHLLGLELGLGPGDRIGLDADPGWPTATVVLAAWWAGIGVQLVGGTGTGGGTPDVWVVHEARPGGAPPGGVELFWLGDGIDGAPMRHTPGQRGEAWTHAVQAFPDQPPAPGATAAAEGVVLRDPGGEEHVTSQQALLGMAASFDADGPVGIEVDADGDDRGASALELALLCLRPLVTGRATVVIRGVPRSAADGDRVSRWR